VEVVYGQKRWSFDRAMPLEKLVEETGLRREAVLVMADGRLIREGETIPAGSRVLIISAANGG
jgi:sulfur carrier protein ThiS